MDSQTKKAQLEKTFQAFKETPRTMKEVEVLTGIDRPNVCRYVAYFRKRNKITVTHKGTCSITRHRAQFFTTDPERIPKPGQSEMFETKRPRI